MDKEGRCLSGKTLPSLSSLLEELREATSVSDWLNVDLALIHREWRKADEVDSWFWWAMCRPVWLS